ETSQQVDPHSCHLQREILESRHYILEVLTRAGSAGRLLRSLGQAEREADDSRLAYLRATELDVTQVREFEPDNALRGRTTARTSSTAAFRKDGGCCAKNAATSSKFSVAEKRS